MSSIHYTNGTLSNGTTYYYKAVKEGYFDVTGSFTVSGSNPAVNFTMTAKAVYNYTVNAVDAESSILKATIQSGNSYADESATFSLPACVLVGSTLHFTNEFSKTETVSSADQIFSYAYTTSTVENVKYFYEGENLNVKGSSYGGAGSNASKSNGADRRPGGSSNLYTPALEGGVYTVYIRVYGNNAKTPSCPLYYCDVDGTNTVSLELNTPNASASSFTTISVAGVAIPDGKSLCFYNGGSDDNSNFAIDYIYLVKEVKTATIGSAGFATLYTDKSLDFSEVSGLEAYTATVSENTVSLTKVDNVPANTGVVLKGAVDTYSIPVTASSSTAQGDLQGSASATAYNAYDGYTLYVLTKDGEGDAQFNPVNEGEIAAGKAFLKVANADPTRSLQVVFTGEATGISSMHNSECIMHNEVFNLNGQRVSAPAKGLYIVNGKKVVVK